MLESLDEFVSFVLIRPLTTELIALEHLKLNHNCVTT